jgi:hypothetical protein
MRALRSSLPPVPDPPPPSVRVRRNASAGWTCSNASSSNNWTASGNASNGIGGTYTPRSPAKSGGNSTGGTAFIDVNSSSGTFSVPIAVSANMSGSSTDNTTLNGKVSVGADVQIHAHPYSMIEVPGWAFVLRPEFGPTASHLKVPYKWKSTSGSLANLNNVTIYEHVDFAGDGYYDTDMEGTTGFVPDNPPFTEPTPSPLNYYLNNGHGAIWAATTGSLEDFHTTKNLLPGVASYTGTQTYRFKCSVCFQDQALLGSHTIVRSVTYDASHTPHNKFTITKHGHTGQHWY